MKFTLYTADCSGNPKNKAYPHEMIVTSAADLKKAVRFDHVCARYAGNVRSEANFDADYKSAALPIEPHRHK